MNRRRLGWLCAIALSLPSIGLPRTANAQTAEETDPATVEEARIHYAQGAEFFRRERYAEAVAEFTEAFRLWPNATILYGLGQAYEGLTQVHRAMETYRQYLQISPADDPRREEVEGRIRLLERLLATVHIDSNVPAEIVVDGEPEGTAPTTLQLSTGRHRIELQAEGYEPRSRQVVVAAGTEHRFAFELHAIPQGGREIVRVETARRRVPKAVFYGALGVSGAAVLTWGIVGTTALIKTRHYNDDVASTPIDRREVRSWARRSDALLGVAGGLALTTVIVSFFTDFKGESRNDEESGEAPSEPSARIGFTPLAGGAFLSAEWSL